jgi:hypothetical protein
MVPAVIPAKVNFAFMVRRCLNPAPASSSLYSLTVVPSFPGISFGVESIKSTVLALLEDGDDDPLNLDTLQAYAEQWTNDWLIWRESEFDVSYVGIAAIVPNGLIDTIEFEYSMQLCATRAYTGPYIQQVDQLGAQDPSLQTLCPDETTWDRAPAIVGYSPPITQANGSTTLQKVRIEKINGRYQRTFIGQDTFPCGTCATIGATVTVSVYWCIPTDVPPGTITVTVYKNNASGPVIATGTADASGKFHFTLTSTTTCYITASTDASGYLNLPTTIGITVSGTTATPSGVGTRVYPDQLTLTDPVVGEVTVYPYGTLSLAGIGSYANYIGSMSFDYPAACSCDAGSVVIQWSVQTCVGGPDSIAVIALCPNNYPTDFLACPDTSGSNVGDVVADFTGTGPQQPTCYPVNMTATAHLDYSDQTGGWATLFQMCSGAFTETYTLTQ